MLQKHSHLRYKGQKTHIRHLLSAGAVYCLLWILFTVNAVRVQNEPRRYSHSEDPPAAVGQPIRIARATWDTGWFQTEIIRSLLEKLGYTVDDPVTMDNARFYRACASGAVDL